MERQPRNGLVQIPGRQNNLAPAARLPENGLAYPLTEELLEYLGIDLAPDFMGGWRIVPKKWGADPGGTPYYGFMLKRKF